MVSWGCSEWSTREGWLTDQCRHSKGASYSRRGVTPICSSLFRFPRFLWYVPICVSCFREVKEQNIGTCERGFQATRGRPTTPNAHRICSAERVGGKECSGTLWQSAGQLTSIFSVRLQVCLQGRDFHPLSGHHMEKTWTGNTTTLRIGQVASKALHKAGFSVSWVYFCPISLVGPFSHCLGGQVFRKARISGNTTPRKLQKQKINDHKHPGQLSEPGHWHS